MLSIRTAKPGLRVRINAGKNNGQTGHIVEPRLGKGCIPLIEGADRKFDSRKEAFIKLDDGSFVTMFLVFLDELPPLKKRQLQ